MGGAARVRATAALLLLLCAARLSTAAPVYAAPSGCSDEGSGTPSSPLCSIAAALEKARAAEDREVVLRAGTFRLKTPLRLGPADSGLTLRAANGERVTISGGVEVVGWRQSARAGIWAAPLPAAFAGRGSSPRQLYVNGRRANRTSCNATVLGAMNYTDGDAFQTPAGKASGAGGYSVSKPALKGWHAVGDVEFVYAAQIVPWTEPRCGVRSVSDDGLAITMEGCIGKLPAKPGAARRWFMAGLPSSIENAKELLNASKPGEFYVDRAAAQVLYVPHPHEDMATAQAVLPLLQSVLVGKGATHLNISGIDWAHTAWGGPDTPCGYVPTQAGMHPMSPECLSQAAGVADEAEPVPAAAVRTSQNTNDANLTFVMGAGASIGGLDSKSGPDHLISRSGQAIMTMQSDA